MNRMFFPVLINPSGEVEDLCPVNESPGSGLMVSCCVWRTLRPMGLNAPKRPVTPGVEGGEDHSFKGTALGTAPLSLAVMIT